MKNFTDLNKKITKETGYEYNGRSKNTYVYTGYVDRFMEEIHGLNWNPKVYLDIGSRDLIQTIEVAQYHPDTKFIAFEPVPWQYQICYERSLEWDNIEVFNFAISDEEGFADFWQVNKNTGGSSLLEPIDVPYSDGTWEKIKVRTKRLDSVLEFLGIDSVDCIWMDTQGTELKALKSLGNYLNDVLFIHTEASPNPYYKDHILKNELEYFLHSHGFSTEFIPNPMGHPYGEGDVIASKPNKVRELLTSNIN
jgi:FkbM family methyltransferase